MGSKMTREQWLEKAVKELQARVFKGHAKLPKVRVSTGFPSSGGTRSKNATIGEFWNSKACEDKVPQIFISPSISEGVRALDVLVHELVHACVPDAGHRAPFKKIAVAVGLEGKMTATYAGDELESKLKAIVKKLGKYPHAKINYSNRKKEGTRLLKAECLECGYTVRVTRKWIEELGAPICPCNHVSMFSADDV